MADNLLRCPFCGGEARVVEERLPQGTCWQVGCCDRLCYAYYGKGYLYPTRRAAIVVWNRREERTCRMVENGCEFCCSECDGRVEYNYEANYCPACGARVVEEG